MSLSPKAASLSLRLSSLPKVDKTHFVSTFVQDQIVHANSYVLQGPGSQWDRVASVVDGVQAQHAFGTPVLKPRVPAESKLETACALLKDHKNDLPGFPNGLAEDYLDRTTHNQNKRKRQGSNPVTKRYVPTPNKQIRTQNSKPSLKETDSNIHPEDEQSSRRRERRDRKRIKRAIISPSRSSDVENMSDEKPLRNTKKNSKKAKIPAGFALMHGFNATNVGARRLTIKPSLSIGVFNKGKASAKIRATHKSTKKDRQSTGFSELGFLNKGDRERQKSTEKGISKPRLSDTDSQSRSSDQSGDLETQRSKFVITNRRTTNTKRPEKKKRTAGSLPGNERKSPATLSNSPSMQARSNLEPLLKATLAESIVWDIEVEPASLLAPVLASEKHNVVLEVCNRPWNVLPTVELVGPHGTHDQFASRSQTLSDKADDLPEPKSPSSSLAPSQSASQNGRFLPPTHGTIPLAGASSKYFSLTPNPQASGADHHVSIEKPSKRASSKQAEETTPPCYLDVMPPPNRLQVPDSVSLEDADPDHCLDTHQCCLPGGAPCSQPSSREHSASCLWQPDFDADGGNDPYDISLELNDPRFTTRDLEDSVDYCTGTQDLDLWSSVDHDPFAHDGCGVLADPVLCHSLYDDSGEFGETASIILESIIEASEVGHSEEYAMDSTFIFGDNQELEALEEDITTSNLCPDNQNCPECFGGQYETSELNYEQYRAENIDGESLASSNSKSIVGSALDDLYLSDHASAMFSQGRALLLGEGNVVQTRPRQPMLLLSMVEADVAKSLKNHWLPQKL